MLAKRAGSAYNEPMNSVGVPLPTVKRLPFYLRLLKEALDSGTEWLSSETIGERLRLGAIQVRKDLAMVGAEGRARRGFPVQATIDILTEFLGGDDYADVFLVGSGPLAEAVLVDPGLHRHGFSVLAVFEPNPQRVGQKIRGYDILPINKLPDLARRMGVRIAIFAVTDPSSGEELCRVVEESALRGVFDVSGLDTRFPPNVVVEREDFGSRLARLVGAVSVNRTT